ncbi:MAG TPA: hypothetical protein VF939_17450 [Puia sp.]
MNNFDQKKTLLSIVLVMAISITVVITLAWIANKPLRQKNGFSRLFAKGTITLLNVSPNNDQATDICGVTKDLLYFSLPDPAKILVSNHILQEKRYLFTNVSPNSKLSSNFNYLVSSSHINLFAGNASSIYIIDLPSRNTSRFNISKSTFTRAISISSNSFILRGFDSSLKTQDQIFIKVNPVNGLRQKENNISEKKNDAGITTDGILRYDSFSHSVIYTYFYRNEFLCLDTNLNLRYIGKTIDTLNTFQVVVGALNSQDGKTFTNISPSRIVNWQNCISNNRLFVNSMIQADNEEPKTFNTNSAIDVYNLTDGHYLGSFYIPLYKDERVRQIQIYNDLIIVLYKNYITTYKMSLNNK